MWIPFITALAQVPPWEDDPATTPPPAPAPVHKTLHFTDLQNGFQQWNTGGSNNTFRNGMLVVLGIVLLVALVIHWRQKQRTPKSINSQFRLALELGQLVPFPFGTRLLLWWVARSTGTHFAALLLSARAFEASLNVWAAQPTFGLVRRWGRTRLVRLQGILFDESARA